MIKLGEYEKSIEVLDSASMDILEKLGSIDPTSEEYRKAAENLKLVQEAKQSEVKSYNESRNSLIPQWATGILGSIIAVGFGSAVMRAEKSGEVISSQAVNFWDKIVRKIS